MKGVKIMNKTVLIADDSRFMRDLLKKHLKDSDFKVIAEASDGCEAVSLYRDVYPDLVIMDLNMPCKNGMNALENIKNMDSNAKVVICSAMGQQRIIIEALGQGAKDFVVKPYFNELVPTLKKLV